MMLENGGQEHACKLLDEMPLLVAAKGALELLLDVHMQNQEMYGWSPGKVHGSSPFHHKLNTKN